MGASCFKCTELCEACRSMVCACGQSSSAKPEFNVVCIGISNAGKSTILTKLTNRSENDVTETIGFSVVELHLSRSVLKVKELGGNSNVRKFWHRYFDSSVHAVTFVIDGTCTQEELEETRTELHKSLLHPQLAPLPWLILCNKQDVEGACTGDRAMEELQLSTIAQDRQHLITVRTCSKKNRDNLLNCFENFSDQIIDYYDYTPNIYNRS